MVWDSAQAYNACTASSDSYCNDVKSHFIGTNRWLKTPPKETKPVEQHWTERLPTKLMQRSRDAKSVAVPQKVSIVKQLRTEPSNNGCRQEFKQEGQTWPSLPCSAPAPRRADIELLANGWEVVRDDDFSELEKQAVHKNEGAENRDTSNQPTKSTDSNSFFNWIWCETKTADCSNTASPPAPETEAPSDPLSTATFSYAEALKR
jgi:hypothetical protein